MYALSRTTKFSNFAINLMENNISNPKIENFHPESSVMTMVGYGTCKKEVKFHLCYCIFGQILL